MGAWGDHHICRRQKNIRPVPHWIVNRLGRNAMKDFEPVAFITFSANSRALNSAGLPGLIGPIGSTGAFMS